jgi:hypothetical protein
MGVWGVSLYGGDFAMDLKSAVAAVARLPLADHEIVEALRSTERAAADHPDDPDHAVFWLVLADQLARRGIYPGEVKERALRIIDEDQDLQQLRSLGAAPGDLRKRQAKLAEIKAALVASAPKVRKTLARPQPLVMAAGEVLAFPTSAGKPINPYFKSKAAIPNWRQDGFGMLAVIETGHVFGYLAWFRVAKLEGARPQQLEIGALWKEPLWALCRPGTCSPLHLRRMELRRLGKVDIDGNAVARLFPDRPSPRTAAIIDKSIANHLQVGPQPLGPDRQRQKDVVHGLAQIARPLAAR